MVEEEYEEEKKNKKEKGQTFGVVVKKLLGTPTSHTRIFGFE